MSAPVQRRHLAELIYLDEFRPPADLLVAPQTPAAGVGEAAPPVRATLARVANSPAARDLRAHGWLVGLLLAVLVLLIAAGWL